jgi:hypothetical protein
MAGRHSRPSSQSRSSARIWARYFLLFTLIIGAWELASPLASGADEPTSIGRAEAVARGQWVGTPDEGNPAQQGVATWVTIPVFLLSDCFHFHPSVSAACQPPVPSARPTRRVGILTGRYPPLYFLVVGLPSLLPGGAYVVYLMRLAGVLMNAAVLALAAYAITRWARSRAMLLGFGLAVSPMIFFFSSVINPSGLELTSSVCLWAALAIWLVDHPAAPPRGLLWTVAGATAIVVQSRPLGLLWPFLAIGALAPLVVSKVPLGALVFRTIGVLRRRDYRPMLLLAGTSIALALAWTLAIHSLRAVGNNFPPPGTPESTLLKESIDYMPGYLQQAVGVFGWVDTTPPRLMTDFWYAGVVGLLGSGLLISRWRGRLAILFVMVLSFVVPVGGTLLEVHTHGFASQGRYFLPVFVGMPIVAAALIGRGLRERRLHFRSGIGPAGIRAALGLVAVAQVVAFGAALRRYLVGVTGPIWPTTSFPHTWHPPIPAIVLDAAATVALLALYWYLGRPAGTWITRLAAAEAGGARPDPPPYERAGSSTKPFSTESTSRWDGPPIRSP